MAATLENSGFAALELAGPLAERVCFGEQPAAAQQQVFALRRQLHAPADAVEQRHAKIGFQRLDLAR